MRKYFEYAARTRTLVLTFAGTLVFLFLVFPNLPIGGEMLDVKPGYTHTEAMDAMDEYGAEGRTIYAWASGVLDTLFFPLIYVTLFAGLIYRFRPTEGMWLLAFVPVIAGIWDVGENVQIVVMLIQYPDIGETQVAWASAFTSIKGNLVLICLLLGLGLPSLAMSRRLLAKFRSTAG